MNKQNNFKMTANLLYEDREWKEPESYYDAKAIREDLQLDILFTNSGREQELKQGTVQTFVEHDTHLEHTLAKVMLVPLENEKQIYYRQEIMRDFLENEKLIKTLYDVIKECYLRWEAIGKDLYKKNGREANRGTLITKIQVLQLYISNLVYIKTLLGENEDKIIFQVASECFLSEKQDMFFL